MSDNTSIPQSPHIVRRISRLLRDGADTDAINAFLETCRALSSPLERPAADAVLTALGPRLCRELEPLVLQYFQQRLRSRSTDKRVPRPVAELQSAAKAWGTSVLVLLAEFVDAPVSDRFWRLLARLARTCSSGSDDKQTSWPAVRDRLYAERQRRRHDVSARRQGVSRSLPWAIPDVEAVLHQLQSSANREATPSSSPNQPAITANITSPDRESEGSTGVLVSRPPERTERETSTDSSEQGAQLGIWRLAYGWWLPKHAVLQLCDSLVQIQPTFAVVDLELLGRVPSSPASATTLFVPLCRDTTLHWHLCVLHRLDKVVSLYRYTHDLPDPEASGAAVAAADDTLVAHVLATALPEERQADWTVSVHECPRRLQNPGDMGVAVVILLLHAIIGRDLPAQVLDYWIWRRALAHYMSRVSLWQCGGGFGTATEQAARNIALAMEFTATHTALYENTDGTDKGQAERRAVLHAQAVEARTVWAVVATMASTEVAKARTEQDEQTRQLQEFMRLKGKQPAIDEYGLALSISKLESRVAALSTVQSGVRAALADINMLLLRLTGCDV